MAEEIDIDALRYEHESSAEWELRKPFLQAHYDKFDETRLKCLSNCFVNVEIYGCTYPAAVMNQIKLLTEDIKSELKQWHGEKKERLDGIKFVPASGQQKRQKEGLVGK